MSYNTEKNRVQKGKVYKHLWSSGRKIKKYLTLPSRHGLDIRHLLETGAITLSTEIVAFEKYPSIAKDTKKLLTSLGFKKFTVHVGEIEKHSATIIESHMEKKFDLIFFDFCGNLSRKVQKFLKEVAPVIAETRVACTFDLHFRRLDCSFYTLDELFMEHAFAFYNVPNIELSKENCEWTMGAFICAINEGLKDEDEYENFGDFCYEVNESPYVTCGISNVIIYKEESYAHTMTFFIFSGKGRYRKSMKLSLEELQIPQGKKAWITRRKNEKKKSDFESLTMQELWSKYHSQTSAGKKAAIRRIINKKVLTL